MYTINMQTNSNTLYDFFWVIPRRLNFICRRFRTLCLFHLYRQVGVSRMTRFDKYWGINTPTSLKHGTDSVLRNVGI